MVSAAHKIAFIGSHSVRKTNAVHSFASAVGRSGRSVEVGREVVRFSPLGINEGATPEAQLWTLMSQIREELELRVLGPHVAHMARPHVAYYGVDDRWFLDHVADVANRAAAVGAPFEGVEVPGDHMSCLPHAIRRYLERCESDA